MSCMKLIFQNKPSKKINRREIQKFKPNLRGKLLTKVKKPIIIPVQIDWSASNEREMRNVAIDEGWSLKIIINNL